MARSNVHDGLFETDETGARLLCGRCDTCGNDFFPRNDTCPYCASSDVAQITHDGAGARLWAWTTVQAAAPGYGGAVPYGFGVAELRGGLRVITRLADDDPATMEFGAALRLVIEVLGTDADGVEIVTWAFAPASATDADGGVRA